MLRGTCRAAKSVSAQTTRNRFYSQTYSNVKARSSRSTQNTGVVMASAALTAGAAWYASQVLIHNDAVVSGTPSGKSSAGISGSKAQGLSREGDSLETLVWGSNRSHLLFPDGQTSEAVRTPTNADWLENIALRDLALHEKHAACVDAKGDVYQWGDGYFGQESSSRGTAHLTLRGKNIIRLQVTPTRVFALSASGRIYVLSPSMDQQNLPLGTPTPASTPWWGTGWLWGEEEDVDFAEITPNEKLGWNEKFIAISAGNDHILALTSLGRTFAHPINLKANDYGQLGFRKFDIPDHSSPAHPHARKALELTPKSIADPYAKSTPAIRKISSSSPAEKQQQSTEGLNDKSIKFSDRLFEVPALAGIKVEQIAAGGRSSFVRTEHGRVLGWGANEYGQIGLGGNVTLEAITVPTEVILWRSTPQTMRTMCLDVYAGGDLTFFKVERTDGSALPYIDVLACGNGQWGGLGNAQYSNAQGTPVRARNISGLLEYSEKTNNLQPIYPHDISISPTGHVLLTLDTLARAGPGGAGRDLVSWGANQDYQLGNGKRGSMASPTTMESQDGERFILAKKKAEVRDLSGKVWKKGVEVEQCAVAGYSNSVVYWKICTQ